MMPSRLVWRLFIFFMNSWLSYVVSCIRMYCGSSGVFSFILVFLSFLISFFVSVWILLCFSAFCWSRIASPSSTSTALNSVGVVMILVIKPIFSSVDVAR